MRALLGAIGCAGCNGTGGTKTTGGTLGAGAVNEGASPGDVVDGEGVGRGVVFTDGAPGRAGVGPTVGVTAPGGVCDDDGAEGGPAGLGVGVTVRGRVASVGVGFGVVVADCA